MLSDNVKQLIIDEYGENEANAILEGMQGRVTTFRINPLKSSCEEIESLLNANSIEYKKCDWFDLAYLINNNDENKLRELDIYKEGKIYLQSLSSMIPAILIEPKEGDNILDMCAAPGGKTTLMSTLSNNKALITACEKNKIRHDRLMYNIQKQGAKGINVINQDSRELSNYFSFDKILLDAPCSGSGTLLEGVESKGDINKEYVEKLVKVQRKLLDKATTILKTGGTLIYSTCSIFKEENEDNISYILNKYNNLRLEPIDIEQYINMEILPTKYAGTICIKPNNYFEGFFVAKITKI